MSSKYERRYNWLYYSAAKGGYCCKICELFAQESDNIFIKGTTLGEFAYESVKSKKLNKRNAWYFCFYYRVCFFPILYKTTRKFPILGVGSCSQNAEKKPWDVKNQIKQTKTSLWNIGQPSWWSQINKTNRPKTDIPIFLKTSAICAVTFAMIYA